MKTNDRHTYEIIVEGHLSPSWSDWFGDFELYTQDHYTCLRGAIPDQAALFGVLKKVHNLGLVLVSVVRLSVQQVEERNTDES